VTARGDLLFSTNDLFLVLQAQEQTAHKSIDSGDPDKILAANTNDLVAAFFEDFRFNPLVLKEDQVRIDQREMHLDVSRDPYRMIPDRTQPFYVKGTEIAFFVPFEGDAALFASRPSTFTLSPPRGQVNNGELVMRYVQTQPDAAAFRREFDRDIASIKQYLTSISEQVTRFNAQLTGKINQWIETRRNWLLTNQNMVASLGFPLRPRPDAPTTYAAPNVRRKPAIARVPNSARPFQPEPELELTEYEHILSVISNMVHVMERSPRAFKGMGEEDLRQHFLVQLNGQYEGQATGETFNFEGKTDILIRSEGKNIFIAECKFWKGPESLSDAIDQLLGYGSWRDTKTALLVFNRDRNFTTVLEKIPGVVRAHAQFKRRLDYKVESGSRFALRHRDDSSKELILTVLAFEVPA
jgi:hypothetical protein